MCLITLPSHSQFASRKLSSHLPPSLLQSTALARIENKLDALDKKSAATQVAVAKIDDWIHS